MEKSFAKMLEIATKTTGYLMTLQRTLEEELSYLTDVQISLQCKY
jgi:hypothetical protein